MLSGLKQDDEQIQTEIFGPVITVQKFSDESRGPRLGQRRRSTAWPPRSGPRTTAAPCGCRSNLDFGVVWINTHIPFVSEMPHGGFKHSGYGKDLSMYGLEDYTRIKHVMSYIGE